LSLGVAQRKLIKESDWKSEALIQPLLARNRFGYNCLEVAIIASNRAFVEQIFALDPSQWKKLMRNAQISQDRTSVSTPMRKLVEYMPDLACVVLDRCRIVHYPELEGTSGIQQHQHIESIEYEFEFLEDHCHVQAWEPGKRRMPH
jgi:hypothetical protein